MIHETDNELACRPSIRIQLELDLPSRYIPYFYLSDRLSHELKAVCLSVTDGGSGTSLGRNLKTRERKLTISVCVTVTISEFQKHTYIPYMHALRARA